MNLLVKLRETITWREFLKLAPNNSIALDGYVEGMPRYSAKTKHINFNHHENVNRLATRCTAAQVVLAIKQSIFLEFPPEQTSIFVNDCDQDVCTAVWLLKNWERLSGTNSEPLISKLIFNVDMLDTCAGAYPINTQSKIMKQMCWIFEPYTQARVSGILHTLKEGSIKSIIEAVEQRITKYSLGEGEVLEADARYENLGGGETWALVKEQGNEARTAMRAAGIQSFVSSRGKIGNNYIYSIGNLTPFGGLPLLKIYYHLNTHEGIETVSQDKWGGSDSCGGSPRNAGSKFNQKELTTILNKFLDENPE